MKHVNGKHIPNVLDRGLTQLRQQGKIKQAYQESGFYHPITKDWPVLNSEY